ncbi:LRR receptor-like serine/threonine-protein kinase IOS1 [Arachis hypogaea]|uniref:LRR receptor-like serine/threonine-protein kinase IOS1 n=1 Tax=Arachis hypogaea TaxID=3818 RepID=UPI003B221F0F
MKTAAQSLNMSHPLELGLSTLLIELDDATEYYVYFHFGEIQKLTAGRKRLINIALNSQSIHSQPLVLEYLKPVTVGSSYTAQVSATFSISAALGSEAPPILNAFEVYKLITQIDSPTDPRDVGGMKDIKSAYQISRLSWQGDPCLPDQFAWEGLTCNYQTNPRITSLDLSNNELEGSLPEFLGDLSKLKVL